MPSQLKPRLNEDRIPNFARPRMLFTEWRQDGWLTGSLGESAACQSHLFLYPATRKRDPLLWEHSQLDIPWDEYKSFKGLHVELDNRPHCVPWQSSTTHIVRNSLRPVSQWASQRNGNTKHDDKDLKDQCFQSNNLQVSQRVGKNYIQHPIPEISI